MPRASLGPRNERPPNKKKHDKRSLSVVSSSKVICFFRRRGCFEDPIRENFCRCFWELSKCHLISLNEYFKKKHELIFGCFYVEQKHSLKHRKAQHPPKTILKNGRFFPHNQKNDTPNSSKPLWFCVENAISTQTDFDFLPAPGHRAYAFQQWSLWSCRAWTTFPGATVTDGNC